MIDAVEELIPLPVGEVTVTRPRDAEALLSEEQFEHEEFLPYWAELWSSGVALAHDVARRSLRGERVLELGCGLGLPSIAAAMAGGRVLATDWSPDAIRATEENARRNVELLLDLLPRLVDRGGEVLIADPSRSPAERFLELAPERWELRTSESPRAPRTRIHRLRLR